MRAEDWHSKISFLSARINLFPDASLHKFATEPSINFALQVPQVPDAHSYGRHKPERNAAYKICSDSLASNGITAPEFLTKISTCTGK